MKKALILLLTIAVCIGICINLRGNRKETTFQKIYDTRKSVSFTELYYAFTKNRSAYHKDYKDIENFKQLENDSQLIADVEYVSRRQMHNIIETEVAVKKIYKGQCDKRIMIYEPAYVLDEYEEVQLMQPKPFMEKNETYLVFLRKSFPKNGQYYIMTNTILGNYPRNQEFKIIERNDKDGKVIIKKEALHNVELVRVHYNKKFAENEGVTNNIKVYEKTLSLYPSFKQKALQKYQ